MKEENKEILTDFIPSRWIVPEQREVPTSMTLYPQVAPEDIPLSLKDKLPDPKLFYVDEMEIE